jgi:hypothetical protein
MFPQQWLHGDSDKDWMALEGFLHSCLSPSASERIKSQMSKEMQFVETRPCFDSPPVLEILSRDLPCMTLASVV